MRRALYSVVMMAVLVGLAALGTAGEKQPDATLKLSEGSVAAGIGWSWGKGTLTFQGKDYPFKVEGLSVGDVGISRADATGKVYNLKKVEDFTGTYSAGSAAATVGGGAGVTSMRNQNGVEINLTSTTQGVAFKVAAGGIKLTLQK